MTGHACKQLHCKMLKDDDGGKMERYYIIAHKRTFVVLINKSIQSAVVDELCNQIWRNAERHDINKTRVIRVNY